MWLEALFARADAITVDSGDIVFLRTSIVKFCGVPYGSRTRVTAVKGKRPFVIQRNQAALDSTLPHLKDSGDAYWTFIDSHLPWRWIFLTSYLVGGRRVAPSAGDLSIYPFDRAPVTRKTTRWLYTINLQDFLEERSSSNHLFSGGSVLPPSRLSQSSPTD